MLYKSLVLVLVLAGCTSAPKTEVIRVPPPATAELEVLSLSPAPDSTLDESSVLVADIKYTIHSFRRGTGYYVVPQFASKQGYTFNMFELAKGLPRLTKASGRITIRHPVVNELRHEDLARPIVISFYLMEAVGEDGMNPIGTAGPFQYH